MLFDPSNKDVLQYGIRYLQICCGFNSLVYAVMYTFDSFAIGIGHANIAMCNALADALVVRLPVCWFLTFVFDFGYSGIYIGQAVSPLLPSLAGLIFFTLGRWEYYNPLSEDKDNTRPLI